MSIKDLLTIQPLIKERCLLIADVTCLQLFTVQTHELREHIKTLVSYNIRNDGQNQDTLQVEQGHLITPTKFMGTTLAIDPKCSVVVTWTPVHIHSFGTPEFQQSFLQSLQ